MRRALSAAILLVSILLFNSCGIDGDRVLERIDAVIAALDTNSEEWQTLLKSLSQDLQSLEKQAALDVDNIIARATTRAGVEFRCEADFIGDRVKEDLQRYVDIRRGKTPSPPQPKVCQVIFTPPQFELASVIVGTTSEIVFYGYNFDLEGIQVVLVHREGEISLNQPDLGASPFVNSPTHYMLSVITYTDPTTPGQQHPMCNLQDRRFVIRWNGEQIRSVGVIPAKCPSALPAPTPYPEKRIYDVTETRSSHGTGVSEDRTFGGSCDTGYKRSNIKVSRVEGGGHCEFVAWTSNSESSCKAKVHFGAAWNEKIRCHVEIFEIGEQLPAPTPEPCPCK